MSDIDSLLPPNATPQMRAIEAAMAEPLVGIDAPISTLWNADTCPAPLLPWLAWSFSVEIWDHDWSEATRRSVVREAIGVHQWKGTKTAIKRVLAAVGFDIELSEWFEHGGEPHTFRVTAFNAREIRAGFIVDPAVLARLKKQIEPVKPVRSHMELVIGESFTTEIRFSGAAIDQTAEALPHDILAAHEQFESESAAQVAILDIAASTDTHDITVETTDFQAQASAQSAVIHSGVDTILHDVQTRGSA